ncbi:MAG TPA: hypothetical protein VM658_06795 [bacterium]|nr:hypothetical protein [bacterium]
MNATNAETGKNADGASRPLTWRGFAGRVREGIRPEPVLDLIGPAPIAGLAREPRAELIKAKSDKGSRVYRAALDLGAGEEELFIKSFDSAETRRVMTQRMLSGEGLKRPWHYPVKIVKLLYAPSPARRSWRAAEACARAGVPVADHLLYLERGWGYWREEVLVTRGVNPRSAPDARQFMDYFFRPPLDKARLALKRTLIAELGVLLRKVRDSGIMFPDFKLHNLVLEERPGRAPRLVVIDLSEALLRPSYPEMLFLKRFSPSLPEPPVFTASDRVRLLKSYLAAGNDPRSWPELCRSIAGT